MNSCGKRIGLAQVKLFSLNQNNHIFSDVAVDHTEDANSRAIFVVVCVVVTRDCCNKTD